MENKLIKLISHLPKPSLSSSIQYEDRDNDHFVGSSSKRLKFESNNMIKVTPASKSIWFQGMKHALDVVLEERKEMLNKKLIKVNQMIKDAINKSNEYQMAMKKHEEDCIHENSKIVKEIDQLIEKRKRRYRENEGKA